MTAWDVPCPGAWCAANILRASRATLLLPYCGIQVRGIRCFGLSWVLGAAAWCLHQGSEAGGLSGAFSICGVRTLPTGMLESQASCV